MAAEAVIAPFRQGLKEVYLYEHQLRRLPKQILKNHSPNFSLTLIRTPRQPPIYASFIVPLWFNKLDLRDYLYNAYNVRILNVRSYVKLQRIRQGKPTGIRGEQYMKPQYKRWHRPRSRKHMTVELEQPFVWPEPPTEKEDLAPFNKVERDLAEEEQKVYGRHMNPVESKTMVNEERRKSMREQAQALLEGRTKWKPVAERGFGSGSFPR